MRILVLVADYPRPDGNANLYYVHTRNLYYATAGEDVKVLNFASKIDYSIDGIPVFSPDTFHMMLAKEKFDIAVLHAPNLRNHFLFLLRHARQFPNLAFILHGHEVLRISRVYPRPYSYLHDVKWYSRLGREAYDFVKLRLWRRAFSELATKSRFIFVSQWMVDEFLKWVRVQPTVLEGRYNVIANSVGALFETESYDWHSPKEWDFVTVRSNLDGSKYCIDVVTELARYNQQFRFCVVGKGDYYHFNQKPGNLTLYSRHLGHDELLRLLNRSRCALLPTRADAQGVMACEMATLGIPLITSDIQICREVFSSFANVAFIRNENAKIDLSSTLENLRSSGPFCKNARYFACNTTRRELQVLRDMVRGAQT